MIRQFLKGCIFYPCSGSHENPIQLLKKLCQRFFYVDHGYSREDLEDCFKDEFISGYELSEAIELSPEAIFGMSWNKLRYMLEKRHHEYYGDVSDPFVILYRFKRLPELSIERGPETFELLFARYEGVETYKYVFARRKIAPLCLVHVAPGGGMGGNYLEYSQKLSEAIRSNEGGLPPFIIHEKNAKRYEYLDIIEERYEHVRNWLTRRRYALESYILSLAKLAPEKGYTKDVEMTLYEYLHSMREPMPDWLKRFQFNEPFSRQNFFTSRLVYYPGSETETDGHPVKLFGSTHSSHCFVYADPKLMRAQIESVLEHPRHRFKGYRTLHRLEIRESDLVPNGWTPHITYSDVERALDLSKPVQLFGFLEVLEREEAFDDSHGPKRLAVLFLGADGIAAYDALFCQKDSLSPPFALLLQDRGFINSNYNRFGHGSLLHLIATRSKVFPQWLLISEDTEPWDGFVRVSGVGGDQAGILKPMRFLYKKEDVKKEDKMVYTMQNLQDAVNEIRNGKYVELEVPAAYHAIVATQNLGDDWGVFLENAPAAILCSQFKPLTFDDVQEYITNQLRHPRPDQNQPANELIKEMLEDCKVYGQRKDIPVEGTNAHVFIFRTPDANDFDKARAVLVLILELFRRLGNSLNDSHNLPGVTIMIRKDEKFFDVKIDDINDRAWCGFDFR